MSQVYFISSAEDSTRVKIGVADEPQKRLRELQVGNPNKLEIVAVLCAGYEMEQALHRAFADERINGEWFVISERLATLINDFRGGQTPIAAALCRRCTDLTVEIAREDQADIDEGCMPIDRRVEKYVARHDKNDDRGVPARQVMKRLNISERLMSWILSFARIYSSNDQFGMLKEDRDKDWLSHTRLFDGGKSSKDHGPGCNCVHCQNSGGDPEYRKKALKFTGNGTILVNGEHIT